MTNTETTNTYRPCRYCDGLGLQWRFTTSRSDGSDSRGSYDINNCRHCRPERNDSWVRISFDPQAAYQGRIRHRDHVPTEVIDTHSQTDDNTVTETEFIRSQTELQEALDTIAGMQMETEALKQQISNLRRSNFLHERDKRFRAEANELRIQNQRTQSSNTDLHLQEQDVIDLIEIKNQLQTVTMDRNNLQSHLNLLQHEKRMMIIIGCGTVFLLLILGLIVFCWLISKRNKNLKSEGKVNVVHQTRQQCENLTGLKIEPMIKHQRLNKELKDLIKTKQKHRQRERWQMRAMTEGEKKIIGNGGFKTPRVSDIGNEVSNDVERKLSAELFQEGTGWDTKNS